MSATNVHGEEVRRPFQPDLDRAIATNFAYLRNGEWLPLMVEFDPKAAPTESHGGQWQWFVDRDWLPHTLKHEVMVPALFRELPSGLVEMPGFRHCVLLVNRKAAASLVVSGLVLGISKTAVTPPSAAAREPVSRSSLCSRPGSRKCT